MSVYCVQNTMVVLVEDVHFSGSFNVSLFRIFSLLRSPSTPLSSSLQSDDLVSFCPEKREAVRSIPQSTHSSLLTYMHHHHTSAILPPTDGLSVSPPKPCRLGDITSTIVPAVFYISIFFSSLDHSCQYTDLSFPL